MSARPAQCDPFVKTTRRCRAVVVAKVDVWTICARPFSRCSRATTSHAAPSAEVSIWYSRGMYTASEARIRTKLMLWGDCQSSCTQAGHSAFHGWGQMVPGFPSTMAPGSGAVSPSAGPAALTLQKRAMSTSCTLGSSTTSVTALADHSRRATRWAPCPVAEARSSSAGSGSTVCASVGRSSSFSRTSCSLVPSGADTL